jgi:hypothetical protein
MLVMQSESVNFEEALSTLGEVMESRGFQCEIVAIGGGALSLLGLISRSTKDIDIVAIVEGGQFVSAETLPAELDRARTDVATALHLPNDWLNSGPTQLLDFGLPEGFEKRMITKRYRGLTIHLAGRLDQIYFKLYAAIDRGPRSKHVDDLWKLEPTNQELLAAAQWARGHDPSPEFLEMSRQALAHFKIEDDSDHR